MAFSIADILRFFHGGKEKERSVFKSEKEAYDFCRKAYRDSGGVTPELRRAYEFYMLNYSDGCEKVVRPEEFTDQAHR
jgi:hypothetical protein